MSTHSDARRSLVGHLALFVALYAGYGALSPFLPLFLEGRGLSAQEIAWLLALATLARMGAGPLAGGFADRRGMVRPVLAGAAVLAGLAAAAHLAAQGFSGLLAAGLAYAILTAPLAPLGDALALTASGNGRTFAYGWVRGAGSLAFILATSLVGLLVPDLGIGVAILAGACLFAMAGIAASLLPGDAPGPVRDPAAGRGFSAVLGNRRFRRVVLAAALVMGAHALHDAFAMILWSRHGIPAAIAGLLWSEAVAAEILVFLLVGPWVLARLDPGRAIALAAAAGTLRWGIAAGTTALPALAAIQGLHGLTFALLHLACLKEIGRCVPTDLTATALTLYGPLGLGLSSVVFTLAAGPLFAAYGASGFWAMSLASLCAVPVALGLTRERGSHAATRVHR